MKTKSIEVTFYRCTSDEFHGCMAEYGFRHQLWTVVVSFFRIGKSGLEFELYVN